MNMNDYRRVVSRMHADAHCREEILSAAAKETGIRKTAGGKPVLRGWAVSFAGAAACFMLLLSGIYLWRQSIGRGVTVQTSMPEITEAHDDETTAKSGSAATTAAVTWTTRTTQTTQTTSATSATSAAQTTAASTVTAAAETQTRAQKTTAALLLTAPAETTTAAAQTTAQPETTPAPTQTAATETTAAETTEPTATTETTVDWVLHNEQELEYLKEAEVSIIIAPYGIIRAAIDENNFTDDEAANYIWTALDGKMYEMDESLYITCELIGWMYMSGDLTYEEAYGYVASVAAGETLPQEIKEKATGTENLKALLIELHKITLAQAKGETPDYSKFNLYNEFYITCSEDFDIHFPLDDELSFYIKR